jgi:hypothetical protein
MIPRKPANNTHIKGNAFIRTDASHSNLKINKIPEKYKILTTGFLSPGIDRPAYAKRKSLTCILPNDGLSNLSTGNPSSCVR